MALYIICAILTRSRRSKVQLFCRQKERRGAYMQQRVITVDGPSGVGKGTLSLTLAKKLGWHFLDSGAIYRALALYSEHKNVDLEDESAVAEIALMLPLTFTAVEDRLAILLEGQDVTAQIREEATGNKASIVAKFPQVRANLLERQRDFKMAPGLIADGRDMGTEVFPDADLKIFLTASAKVRAERRYKQLLESGLCVKMDQILTEVEARDARDRSRKASPLLPAEDAVIIDTSTLSISEVFETVWKEVELRGLNR